MPDQPQTAPLFVRVKPRTGGAIAFTIDGAAAEARAGDTVLTAVLLHGARLRQFEFSDAPRAGFCLMGACQDCWVQLAGGRRLRSCTTLISEGMAITTTGPRHAER